jgi:hypothetical protein
MPAVLAFVGVLVTASVTLAGLLFTRQSQKRLDQEREQSEKRLAQAQAEEQKRLRLDAAMRAAGLFGSSERGPAPEASNATGLLALAELGDADLSVALLVDLWSRDISEEPGIQSQVSTEAAILVINKALQSRDRPNAQLVAAELLCRNSERLDPCQSLHWPSAVDGRWIPDLGPKAKLLIIDGLVRMTTTSAANENALRSLVVRLYGIWAGDPSDRVKGCVGTLIAALIPAVEELTYTEFMHGSVAVNLAQLQKSAESASPNPDGYLERIVADRSQALREWSSGGQGCSFDPGALGTAAHQL